MEKTGRKLFTAELKQLKARGLPSTETTSGATADSAAILAAIAELKADIRSLEAHLRGEVEETASATEAEAAAMREAEQKLAEVAMLKTELRALAVCIQQTKAEIAALRPTSSGDDRLIAVTNELDAIVTATEQATDGILTTAEKIDGLVGQLIAQAPDPFSRQVAEDIREVIVEIYEECNFQDITGQRITKVVKTLQYIEDRVNKMIDIWGAETFTDLPPPPEIHVDDEKKLLNGPALENQGISQADIDKMFG